MKKKEIKKIKNNFSYWENLISQYWTINGKFSKLNSEFDLNFEVIDRKNNKFIVKIMRNDCDKGFLEGHSLPTYLNKYNWQPHQHYQSA